MKVSWQAPNVAKTSFDALAVGDTFKIFNAEAVYVKVNVRPVHADADEGMMELATGTVYPPTSSRVVKVDVEVNVDAKRPSIY